MDGVGDTAGLEKIFLSVKEAWDKEWQQYEANSTHLINLLDQHFNEEELRTFCKYLRVDYDNLPASGKVHKARELVSYLERRGRLNELIWEGRKQRPKASWRELPPFMDESWQRVDLREAARLYASYIQRECGTMRVFGQPEPVSLEGIFTDVYMLNKPTAWRRFQVQELQKEYEAGELPESRAGRKEGLEAARNNRRLFILGKPGAGKTTFLKYIALQAAAGQIDKVPIFISLKALADSGKELSDYVVSQFDACRLPDNQAWVAQLLAAGQGIVMFDGLDEVNQVDEQHQHMAAAIEQFSRKHHKNQFLMTCRIAATEYSFSDFTYVEMADFAPAQVESFVSKWFAAHEPKRRMFLAELAKPESKGLRELARTPLLLALLCLAFDETMAFPQRRVEIYEEAIDALLKKWDSSRHIRRDEIYRDLSLGRKRQMLARVAAETFEKGIYFIPQRVLERMIVEYLRHIPPGRPAEEIDSTAVLRAIEAQHGIFIERAKGIYSFAHLTFQEYFTAKYQVENAAHGAIDHLISQHMVEARWREVFLLTASLLDNANGFFMNWLMALEKMATTEPLLESLVKWANTKAQVRQPDESSPAAWRACYLFFVCALNRARPIPRDGGRGFDLALDRTLDLAHALTFIRDLDHARTLAHDLARALALARYLELARARTPVLQAIQEIIEMALLFDLDELQLALKKLVLPSEKSGSTEWQAFGDELEHVIREHTPWQNRMPSSEQVQTLVKYLEANHLFLACLALAYVSDREGIKNRMLLLPEDTI